MVDANGRRGRGSRGPDEPAARARLTAAAHAAEELLADDRPGPEASADAVAAALARRLEAAGEHDRHRRRMRDAGELQARTWREFRALEDGLAQLRALTDPAAVLAAAPARLGHGSTLDRVVLHTIHDGVMYAEAAWAGGDRVAADALLATLLAAPIPLTHLLAETDMVRRRRPILVRDPATGPASLTGAMGWRAYVAAPVVAGPGVIAVLHADRGPGAAAAQPADRDLLWYFASAVAQAHERARLRRTLRGDRARLRATLAWLDQRSRELADAPIELELDSAAAAAALSGLLSAPTPGPVDTLVFDGVLTRRELEVLRLLAEGASNRVVAERLVISLGTVKFHVNRILTKLRVANRAEAVARYHALVEQGTLAQ